MPEIFINALNETLWMLPLLFGIYVVIEFIELKYGNAINNKIEKTAKAGPFFGAVFGCVPQCGFSVLSSALYNKRLITTGTLLSVYLSTSDEAVPVILAQPDKLNVLAPIIAVKIIIALIAGYTIDFFGSVFKKNKIDVQASGAGAAHDAHSADERGCCGHSFSSEKIKVKDLIVHPLFHTFKISVFIFVVSLFMGFFVSKLGAGGLNNFLLNRTIFQPVIAALIGLIPNCAASVAITEMYLKGGLSFGSVIAGLCSSAGLGLLVLFRESGNKKDAVKIVFLLFSISVAAGIIIQQFCAF